LRSEKNQWRHVVNHRAAYRCDQVGSEAGAALADVALICRFAVKPVVNLERLEPVFAG